MRPKIYVKLGLFDKIYAEVIDENGNISKEVRNEEEILKFIIKSVGKNGVYLRNDLSVKYALCESYDIAVSNKVIKNNKKFVKSLFSFYKSKQNINIDLEGANYFMNIFVEDYKRYLKKQKIIADLKRKRTQRCLALLAVTTTVFIGGCLIKVHSKNQDNENENAYESNYKTELVAVSNEDVNEYVYEDVNEYVYEDVNEYVYEDVNDNSLLYQETMSNVENIIGQGVNEYAQNKIEYFLSSDEGVKVIDACSCYDVDLAFVIALAIKEFSLEESVYYTTLSDGTIIFNPFQIDSRDDGKVFELYNSETNQVDYIVRNFENSTNPDTHFIVSVASIKELLNKYNNNYILAAIGYNMGSGVSDIIVLHMMEENDMTKEEVLALWDLESFSSIANYIYEHPFDCEEYFSKEIQEEKAVTFEYIKNWAIKEQEKNPDKIITYASKDYAKILLSYYDVDLANNNSLFYEESSTQVMH